MIRSNIPQPNTGDRHFHRNGVYKLTNGGVFDLKESYLNDIYEDRAPELRKPRFAIYVCTGAKLVVDDECNQSGHHTRALLQPGSIVIAEAELYFTKPYLSPKEGNSDNPSSYKINLDSVDTLFQSKRSVRDIEIPVLFLGAVESEYNSIAWELTILANPDKNIPNIGYLRIPEGGRIDAIEEWNNGINEIYARHRYERLFECTLSSTNSHILYEAPDVEMIRKILDMNPDSRSMHYNPKHWLIYPRNRPELPLKLYNFQTVIEMNNFDVVYSVPPLYPPIYRGEDQNNVAKVEYLPMIDINSDWFYPRFKYNRPNQLGFKKQGYVLEWKDIQIPEYEWKRAGENHQNGLVDGINYRIGIDFDVHKKHSNQPIGLLRSFAYKLKQKQQI